MELSVLMVKSPLSMDGRRVPALARASAKTDADKGETQAPDEISARRQLVKIDDHD